MPSEFVTKRFPPLITEERHQQILQRLEDNRRRPAHERKGLQKLLGNFVYCAIDGSKINVFPSTKRGNASLKYRCFWHSCDKKTRELQHKERCTLKPVPAEYVDNQVIEAIARVLGNPKKYAQDWLKSLDITKIEEKIAALEEKQKLLSSQLNNGFAHIMTIQDEAIRKSYIDQQKPIENELISITNELTKARDEMNAAMDKTGRLLELRKAFDTDKSFGMKMKISVRDYLADLPFERKRKLIEAVVCPERGGRVEVDHLRAGDVSDDCEDPLKPLYDRLPAISVQMEIDPDKIAHIIQGLEKNNLYERIDEDEFFHIDEKNHFTICLRLAA